MIVVLYFFLGFFSFFFPVSLFLEGKGGGAEDVQDVQVKFSCFQLSRTKQNWRLQNSLIEAMKSN